MSITASHILVPTKERALELHKQITEGASFETLASINSNCPSRANGGNLGPFDRGQMVPTFEQAAFGLEIGALSEPVETQFGWHLVKRTA